MRALVQRVKRASVSVNGTVISSIGAGMVILLGIKSDDTPEDADFLAARCAQLRIFGDVNEKMNLSIQDVQGEVIVVSQVTLYADTRKGNRPSLTEAAPASLAEGLYERFVDSLRKVLGAERVKTGVFRAMMDVEIINAGPVTVLVESQ